MGKQSMLDTGHIYHLLPTVNINRDHDLFLTLHWDQTTWYQPENGQIQHMFVIVEDQWSIWGNSWCPSKKNKCQWFVFANFYEVSYDS